jgi:sulfite reductase (NADPH) hemoprotein beta-component
VGKAVPAEQAPGIIERLAKIYLTLRTKREKFIDTVERLGPAPFLAAFANPESQIP